MSLSGGLLQHYHTVIDSGKVYLREKCVCVRVSVCGFFLTKYIQETRHFILAQTKSKTT